MELALSDAVLDVDRTVVQCGLETRVRSDSRSGVCSIASRGMRVLEYDPHLIAHRSARYVSEQLRAHEEYLSLARTILSDSDRRLCEVLEQESEIDSISRMCRDDGVRLAVRAAKWLLAPVAWLKLRTFHGMMREVLELSDSALSGYEAVHSIVRYGHCLLDADRRPAGDADALARWSAVQSDLMFVYARLVHTARNKKLSNERMYHFMYPEDGV